jgi:hypothetical protein
VPKEKRFTESIKCGHCQNQVPMEVVSSHSTVRDYSDDRLGMSWEAGAVYELNQCPACEEITLRRYLWHSGAMDPSEIEYSQLYPVGDRGPPRGLPKTIESGYHAAQKVRNIDANAYGVLLGRVLDLVCEDRQASGDTLDKRLRHLAENGEIPAKLVAVATGLRKLRNIGAHADLAQITQAELPVLDDLTRAILEYVYSAPLLAREAEERFARLKMQGRKQTPRTGTTKSS